MAITPDYIDGAEHGVATPNTNGGGIANTIGAAGASPAIQGTTKKTGSFAYRHNVAVAGTCYIRKTIWDATDTIVWGSFWFRMDTEINSTGPIAAVGVAAGVIAQIRWDVTNNRISAFFTGGTNQTGSTNLSLSTWYRVAWEMDVSTGTSSLRVVLYDTTGTQLDSIQATLSQSATNATYFQWGWSTNLTGDMYIDDIVCCSSGDAHPLGNIEIVPLKPTADGSHVAGTNVMENQAGTDLGTAWSLINDTPPDSADYIRQAANGTGNYAEVTFENLTPSHSAVVAAKAILSYTSETTTGNNGGCIVSKDNFSSSTTVWGVTGSLADYSDGSTANLFYKSAMVSGVNDDTTVNALAARVGFSGDAAPDPYWVDLIIEVAYTPSSGTEYTQSADGTITSAGTLSRQTNKTLAGSITPAGTLSRQINKTLAGTVASAGALLKQASRSLSGTITSAGTLVTNLITGKSTSGAITSAGTLAKQVNKTLSGVVTSAGALLTNIITGKSVSGTITSAGTLAKQVNKALSGTVTSAGTLAKQVNKTLSGVVTSAGALLTSLVTNKSVSGTITSAGTLAKQINKSLSGTVTSAGALAKQVNKTLSGALTSAGTLVTNIITGKSVSGTVTSAGTLSKQTNKPVSGSVSPAGALSRQVNKNLSGTVAISGTLTTTYIPGGIIYTQTLSGTLPSSGSLVTTFIPASIPPPDTGGYSDGGGLYLSERRRIPDTSPRFNPTRSERLKKEDEEVLIL